MSARRWDVSYRVRRCVKGMALLVSLAFSALLLSAATGSADSSWLAWIGFLPLFVAVRWLRPSTTGGMVKDRRRDGYDQVVMRPGDPWPWAAYDGAPHGQAGSLWSRAISWIGHHTPWPAVRRIRRLTMPLGRPSMAVLAGGFWGGCFYLFCSAGPTPAIGPSAWLLALLIVIPAVYVGLAARPARAIGFKLLTLALGWVLLEAVLHLGNHFGPHDGLLTGSAGEGPRFHWLARLLGYVCTAFLVVCANASLVGLLSRVRLCFPAGRLLAGSSNAGAWPPSQVLLAIQSWVFRQAYPRAPPV